MPCRSLNATGQVFSLSLSPFSWRVVFNLVVDTYQQTGEIVDDAAEAAAAARADWARRYKTAFEESNFSAKYSTQSMCVVQCSIRPINCPCIPRRTKPTHTYTYNILTYIYLSICEQVFFLSLWPCSESGQEKFFFSAPASEPSSCLPALRGKLSYLPFNFTLLPKLGKGNYQERRLCCRFRCCSPKLSDSF